MQTRQKKEPPPRGRGEGFELTAAGQGMDMPRCGSTQSRYTQHTKKSGLRHLEREGENEKTPPQGATGQGLDAFSGPGSPLEKETHQSRYCQTTSKLGEGNWYGC